MICDGCAVNRGWEHRCHAPDGKPGRIVSRGEAYDHAICDCPECKPYPAVREFCEELDAQVLGDITQETEDSPIVQVYGIGWPQDLAAGLWGGSFSPYFKTMDELERWCLSDAGKAGLAKEKAQWPAGWEGR